MKLKTNTAISILILLFSFATLTAQIRYVSKTGSSTPPYTSWATASDSIQKCIEYCSNGDTIIIANGEYKETLLITRAVTIIGSSMDSTVIDGRGLNGILYTYRTIELKEDATLENIKILGKGFDGANETAIRALRKLLILKNTRIEHCVLGVVMDDNSNVIQNVIFNNISSECIDVFAVDTNYIQIINNIFHMESKGHWGIWNDFRGNLTITNNIFLLSNWDQWETGIDFRWYFNSAKVKNNLVYNSKNTSMHYYPSSDTLEITNNATIAGKEYNIIAAGPGIAKIRNNIITKSKKGLQTNGQSSDYNLFWKNENNTTGSAVLGENDIIADPMFVNDSLPDLSKADFRLQMFSPAIDAGDPEILDVDGSRSDIGLFGGPLGQIYTYRDLAPKPPRNVTAQLVDGKILLKWNKNTEADFFMYRVYRDTVENFIYDTTKIIAVLSDTSYSDDLPDYYKAESYYYKITAIDSAINQSAASEEVKVVVTGAAEGPPIVVEEYKLLQNYPNPFNPSTVIPFRLKEGGTVKILIYDIKGELVRELYNGYKPAGYYEVEFKPTVSERKLMEGYFEMPTYYGNDIVSGIYLYRIEVIGEGQIPRFSDMKKMLLIK